MMRQSIDSTAMIASKNKIKKLKKLMSMLITVSKS